MVFSVSSPVGNLFEAVLQANGTGGRVSKHQVGVGDAQFELSGGEKVMDGPCCQDSPHHLTYHALTCRNHCTTNDHHTRQGSSVRKRFFIYVQ